jgi:hypothetical protein
MLDTDVKARPFFLSFRLDAKKFELSHFGVSLINEFLHTTPFMMIAHTPFKSAQSSTIRMSPLLHHHPNADFLLG